MRAYLFQAKVGWVEHIALLVDAHEASKRGIVADNVVEIAYFLFLPTGSVVGAVEEVLLLLVGEGIEGGVFVLSPLFQERGHAGVHAVDVGAVHA